MARQPAKSFRDLVVWQKAHEFVLSLYQATQSMPREETYGLTAQMRRAAVSIPANIAEGFTKRSRKDKARVLNIAEASLEESRYYLILTHDLQYLNVAHLTAQLEEVARLLVAYSAAIRRNIDK